MRFLRSSVLAALGATVLALVPAGGFADTGKAATPQNCSAAATDAGHCLPFIAEAGQDPMVAAVSSAVAAGQAKQAQKFIDNYVVQAGEDARSSRMRTALTKQSPAGGVQPAAKEDGQCCADTFHWSMQNRISWGTCDEIACTLADWLDISYEASVDNPGVDLFWGFLSTKNGSQIDIDNHQCRVKTDLNNRPDNYTGGFFGECTTQRTAILSIHTGTSTAVVPGEWHYVEIELGFQPVGFPRKGDFEFTSARWFVESGSLRQHFFTGSTA